MPRPAAKQSAPLSRAPVKPKYMPTAPGQRGRNQVAPTSGKKADCGLRHGKRRPLGGDAVGAMDGDSGAAPHRDAVPQCDIGLGKGVDAPVEPVFLAEEGHDRSHPLFPDAPADGQDVTARAEGSPGRRLDEHRRHVGIVAPRHELQAEPPHHLVRQRVERRWPIEHRDAQVTEPLETDVGARPVGHDRLDRRLVSRSHPTVAMATHCERGRSGIAAAHGYPHILIQSAPSTHALVAYR